MHKPRDNLVDRMLLDIEISFDVVNRFPELLIILTEVFDFLTGVNDRRIMASAEELADFFEGEVGRLTAEIHGNLSRESNLGISLLGIHVCDLDAVLLGNHGADAFRLNLLLGEDVLERPLGEFDGDGLGEEVRETDDAVQCTFQLADVIGDLFGDEAADIVDIFRPFEIHRFGLLLENGDSRLKVGRLKVGDEIPGEAGTQSLFEVVQLIRRSVARDDNLLIGFPETVKGIEEFFLRLLLAFEELDIIDEKDVDIAILVLEFAGAAACDGLNQLICEHLGRNVEHIRARMISYNIDADGLHEMRLAESGCTVDEERIISFGRRFGDGERCRISILIARARDEGLEGLARIEDELFIQLLLLALRRLARAVHFIFIARLDDDAILLPEDLLEGRLDEMHIAILDELQKGAVF